MSELRFSAIVPAAGESRRMGQPKLLLPFDGRPLIGLVVDALVRGGACPVVVVVPPADAPEGPSLAAAALQAGAMVVTPAVRPAEMRRSVEQGIERLEHEGPPDGLMLTPGDCPGLTANIVRRVRDRWAVSPGSIVVAREDGRRAHPTVLPWDIARQIPALPAEQGINVLVAAHAARVVELEISATGLAADLNTPDDLERWRNRSRAVVMVRLFAVAKQRSGQSEIEVAMDLPATVRDFRNALANQHPALADLAARVPIAVDDDYSAEEQIIHSGARVALIPPVSGG